MLADVEVVNKTEKPKLKKVWKRQGANKGGIVSTFGLSMFIKEMRQKGRSYREIADYINDNNLIPDDYKVSYVAIARWCMNNKLGGDVSQNCDDEAINLYRQNCQALRLVRNAIDVINVKMDLMTKDVVKQNFKVKDLKDLIDSLDKMSIRQTVLGTDIEAMQEKIYRYETVAHAIELIMAKLSTLLTPEQYDEVKSTLGTDPLIVECLRSFAPSKV